MRVGISAYLLGRGENYRSAGVSTYIDGLLRHLGSVASRNDYIAFYSGGDGRYPGVRSATLPFSANRPLVRVPVEQGVLPIAAKALGVELLHGTVNVLPLAWRGTSVVTVPDLTFLHYPDRFESGKAVYLRTLVTASVRRASQIIALSENTKRDLIELLQVESERVRVIYLGVNESFHVRGLEDIEAFRTERLAGRPYVLYVGTLEPRKNVDLLVRAFASVKRRLGLPHVLVLAGGRGWMTDRIFRSIEESDALDHVVVAGFVSRGDLPLWYNAADLFAYPSAYEGFGLPVLEAMACGVPTITSASSALVELAGEACLTVEPGSQEALEQAMTRVLSDPNLATSMRQAGLTRASGFSWHEMARQTVEVYEAARRAG